MNSKLISIVVPAYNEEANIKPFFESLVKVLPSEYEYEFIFVNDGSKDQTAAQIADLHKADQRVQMVYLSRNFGKEIALSAGLHQARGDAAIALDADGQHPVELIPTFLQFWRDGHQVVIGKRERNQQEGLIKRYGSKLFYWLFNGMTRSHLVAGTTDFRLIDREVLDIFKDLTESNRITRALVDWLGFEPVYVPFVANPRMHGDASYSFRKLLTLAVNSFISLSFVPLFLFGYVGLFITILSFITGIFMVIEKFLLHDPWHLNFTNGSGLAVLIIFLVGIVLMAQGLMALYISHIYSESKQRPLFIINKSKSILE